MAYTDGLFIIGNELAKVEVETAAADLDDYIFPCNVTVLQLGAFITEDFVVHSGIAPVLSLGTKTKVGGTFVPLISVTMDESSTSTLKSGDGVKAAQTAIAAETDIDDGDVILACPEEFPRTIPAGQVITLRAAVDTVSAGGSYVPFAILRIDGEVDGKATNVWTATVQETAV